MPDRPFDAAGGDLRRQFDLTPHAGAPTRACGSTTCCRSARRAGTGPTLPAGHVDGGAARHRRGGAAVLAQAGGDVPRCATRCWTVEPLPATWAAKPVATGGRLDVAAALGKLVPPNTVFKSKPAATSPNQVKFTFGRESVAKATYKCKLDSGAFASCSSCKTLKGLSSWPPHVSVFATISTATSTRLPRRTPGRSCRAWCRRSRASRSRTRRSRSTRPAVCVAS